MRLFTWLYCLKEAILHTSPVSRWHSQENKNVELAIS